MFFLVINIRLINTVLFLFFFYTPHTTLLKHNIHCLIFFFFLKKLSKKKKKKTKILCSTSLCISSVSQGLADRILLWKQRKQISSILRTQEETATNTHNSNSQTSLSEFTQTQPHHATTNTKHIPNQTRNQTLQMLTLAHLP